MLQPGQLKKRQRKLEYLKGLLKGKHTIYDILETEVTFYGLTDEPGIFYEAERHPRLWPKIVNGKPIFFTSEGLAQLRKQPNCICTEFGFSENARTYREHLANALAEYHKKLNSN